MVVDKFNPQSIIAFLNQYQRQINLLVVVVLSIYLLAFLADIVWRIIPEPQATAQNTQSVSSANNSRKNKSAQTNINALKRLNLFGDVKQAAAPVQQQAVTDAPQTRLNLVLNGVVSSSDVNKGAAVIEHKGKQNTYGVGEKIEGTNAILRQVHVDRVIIRNGARNETLMLEGLDFKQANRNKPKINKPVAQKRSAAPSPKPTRLSREAAEATQQLRASPGSFIEFISVSPHRENNQMVGYRLSPGKNPTLFDSAGLKRNDIVTQINGLDLSDPQQSMEAMNELRKSESIELSVIRGGELLTLYLELPAPSDS